MKVDFLRSYEIVRDALGVSVWACIGVITRYWLEVCLFFFFLFFIVCLVLFLCFILGWFNCFCGL